jgi:hypothetical protein
LTCIGQFNYCPLDSSESNPYNTKVNIDVKNPKLFKKVRKFYENDGVTFSGDPLDDYDILIDCLAEDLERQEVA